MTPRERERVETREIWDRAVVHMVGPAVGRDGRSDQRHNALHLAAAALRFAGQAELARQVEALA